MTMTPAAFARDFIFRWEDGHSADPNKTHSLNPTDNGNWTGAKQNIGVLVGSNHGVTPAALAAHRGVPIAQITRSVMRALTIAEAADMALIRYYEGPRISLLPWNRVTASILDFGWGAGPEQAIKLLQRMLDVLDDGKLGAVTAGAYASLIKAQGETFVAGAWWTIRDAFYEQIIGTRPVNVKFEKGWDNRSRYFTPGDAGGWWGRFAA